MTSAVSRPGAVATAPDEQSACSVHAAEGVETDLGWGLATVGRVFRQLAASSVADLPGGPRGYLVLTAVARIRPGSQLALAQQLGVDKTVMTYLLDELEAAGLVERRPDPADRRARHVLITERGTGSLTEFAARLRTAEEKLLAPLASDEATAFREMIERVARSAQVGPDVCLVSDIEPGSECG
jgi:DNA-binding MarR family transcriptional regulator